MKNSRKKNKRFSLALVAIVIIAVLAVSALAQNTSKAKTGTSAAVSLTDPNLLKVQETQNQLLATQRRLEESLVRETALRSKVEDAQASFRQQSAEAEVRHAADRAAWQSTASFYEGKWQESRRPVPVWATVWAGAFYGVILILTLQWTHRRIMAAHGSYKKWLRHKWSRRPRINWGGATHG